MSLKFVYFSVLVLLIFCSKELLSQDITQIDYSQLNEFKPDMNKYRDALDDVKFEKPDDLLSLVFEKDLKQIKFDRQKLEIDIKNIMVPDIFNEYLSEINKSKFLFDGINKLERISKYNNDNKHLSGYQKLEKSLISQDFEVKD